MIDKLVIVGVGLIGGSLARALKNAGAVRHVVGLGRKLETLQEAHALGLIDEVADMQYAPSLQAALHNANVVLLAMPVAQTAAVLRALAPYLQAHTIVTDAGSTKVEVIQTAREVFGTSTGNLSVSNIAKFIPAHPIAGSEHNGPAAALATLYVGKNVVITPLPENSAEDVNTVKALWQAAGAVVQTLTAAEHDAVFAAVSHLPHLLSYALVEDLAKRPHAAQLFSYAASGFRDFTRIASSSPEMWRDITLQNRAALLSELDAYQAQLKLVREMVETSNGAALQALFTHSKQARDAWIAAKER